MGDKNFKLKRKRKQKSKEKNVWSNQSFSNLKAGDYRLKGVLKTISKRIYVREARFQLLLLPTNKFLKSFLRLHTQWNRTKSSFSSRC